MYIEIKNSTDPLLEKADASTLDSVNNIRYDLIHQVILWQQSYDRHPISSTKGISQVRGSTRKIYKQKGTGNARHGSIRGAQFVGGGIIFGPNAKKNYNTKINKKVKKLALLHALACKYRNKSITIYSNLNVSSLRYKEFTDLYGKNIGTYKTLFIDTNVGDNLKKCTRNNHKLDTINAVGINVLDIMRHDQLCFSSESFNVTMRRLG